ncbi:MAG: hypothetical protein A4E57_04428 [Syntrophorhabdaceae bacterium PtaU1.Bin034]|nr:MAG: hypothetical protein A4E57_04428 [Syntrophorhabdaceae bacterium PtaU1.Bin034]
MHVHHDDTVLFSLPGCLHRTNLRTRRARAMVAEHQHGLFPEFFREVLVALIREGTREIIGPYPAEPSFLIVGIDRQVVFPPAGGDARISHLAVQAFFDIDNHGKLPGGGSRHGLLRCPVPGGNGAKERKADAQSKRADQLHESSSVFIHQSIPLGWLWQFQQVGTAFA